MKLSRMKLLTFVLWSLSLLGLSSCGTNERVREERATPPAPTPQATIGASPALSPTNENLRRDNHNSGGGGGHEHAAPHGGTLVVLGDEFAHLEFVLDAPAGRLTVYALDGEAEGAVRLAQERLELLVETMTASGQSPFVLHLEAIANPLTGEARGRTSQFAAVSDNLRGVTRFDATLRFVSIRGREFTNVAFNFPQGNEERH